MILPYLISYRRARWRGAFLPAVLLAALFCWYVPACRAQAGGAPLPGTWRPRVEVRRENNGASGLVLVNSRPVLRLRPAPRAEIVASRLRFAIGAGFRAASVRVSEQLPDTPALMLGYLPVISTSAAEQDVGGRMKTRPKRAQAAALEQAQLWGRSLKTALQLPGLTASEPGKVVPLKGKRTVKLGGAARGPIALLYAPQTVQVVINAQTGMVQITGTRVGRETLIFVREGASVHVSTAVQPYAALVSLPVPVTVTAFGVAPSILRRLAHDSALRAVRQTPGATLTLGEPQMEAGRGAYHVPVVATGREMFPIRTVVRVPVQALRLPVFGAAANLFYSNAPERVTQPGTLFAARLEAASGAGSTRLLYHHQNVGPTNLWFSAELVNESDVPCRVLLVGGDAGPERDTVWVGYQAGLEFTRDFAGKRGVVVPLPARSRIALQSARLPRGTTISGLMQLRVLSGAAPFVRISALSYDDPRRIAQAFTAVPWTGSVQSEVRLSPHVYNKPARKLSARYEVGGRWTFVPIGREALTAALFPTNELQGNYGVFYDIDFVLVNPTHAPASARIVFEPSAGMAGGIFEVAGGKTVTIAQTDMPNETQIAAYTLAPGEKRTVRVRTLPLSGSNYPATLIARP